MDWIDGSLDIFNMKSRNKLKRLFLLKSDTFVVQVLLVVTSVIGTLLSAQLYYSRNVRYQVRIDVNKELYLRQLQVYNSALVLENLYLLDKKRVNHGIIMNSRYQLKCDEWGNVLDSNHVPIPNTVRQKDTIITVPLFIANNVYRGRFIQQIRFLKDNCHLLEPEAFLCCDSLLLFVDKHPLPVSRSRGEILSSVWCREDVHNQYISYVRRLMQIIDERIQSFK
jgi:hypothetical protein